MVSRTATLRLQLIDSVSGPSKNAAGAISSINSALAKLGKGGSPEIRRLAKQLEYLQKKAGSIEDFTATRRGFKDLATQMKAAQSNVSRLEAALKSASKPTAKMKADLESAKASLRSTTQAFRDQGNAVRQSERALQSYGIAGRRGISSSQQAIRNEIGKTIREMRRLDQEARKPKPPTPRPPPSQRPPGGGSPAYDAVTAVGGGVVANTGKNIAQKSFFLGVDFNRAAEYQAALGDFKGADRNALNRQAEKIGGDTRFSNVDVVRAQTTVLQRGIRDVKQILDLTQKVTDYSLAMGVTLEEGAEAVTGSALSKRIDLQDTKAIGNFVDFMVWMAKNGGMSNDDVSQFVKYGGAPTTGAKLSDETMAAMGMILRRSGVRGDEAGVFARSAASKLVAPTQKGKDALAAMGIDFSKFTSIDSMNEAGIGIMMKQKFAATLTDDMKQKVRELIQNGEFTDQETGESRSVISDTGEFASQMSQILAPLFTDKNGKMSVQDAKALSKALADYQKYSIDSVDTMGLLNAIAGAQPGIGNLNAFFTDKQGGRANMIFSQWAEFQRLLGMMQNVPGGIANKIGTEANQGIYGDWTKLTGTIETAMTRIGQDWEFATRPMINKANEIVDSFIGLSDSTRRLIEAFGAAAAVLAGYAAAQGAKSLLGRLLGGGGVPAPAAAAGGAGFLGRASGLLGRIGLPFLAATTLGRGSLVDDPKLLERLRGDLSGARTAQVSQAAKVAQAQPIRDQMNGITASWPIAAQLGMRDYIAAIVNGGADAQAEAARVGEDIKTQLSIYAKPDVDTSQLQRALDLARQLAAVLRGEASGGSVATSSAPSADTQIGHPRARGGPVKKGVTYPVGGSGIELFTPGADGFISPGGAGGGAASISVHQTNHFHGGRGKDDGELVRTLDRQLNRAAQTAFSSIRYGDS
ncbi:phage tail tape measure protein, TP901 family [Rhizobium sp. CF080]|uniref:phage tail tape measure protein n=1 Tax=Rhizobium sp. (strain CF080) TaxID=1144310 RepID=UPI0003E7F391|nr:phage tail tape measure protein [Rhizobium sp. CF080]EUB97316.1 phage tail tape measure protein, TP901 family [Rhizobium sp. CF080]